jgi:hypothetical protein
MMNAFREICAQEGFEEHLEATLDRIGDIESLARTREITIKDLWHGGKFLLKTKDTKGNPTGSVEVAVAGEEEGGKGDQWATNM